MNIVDFYQNIKLDIDINSITTTIMISNIYHVLYFIAHLSYQLISAYMSNKTI